MTDSLEAIAANLPPVVRRADLTRLTFGILNSKTMANLDSLGKGIPGRSRIGKWVVYPKKGVTDFLARRTEGNSSLGSETQTDNPDVNPIGGFNNE